MDNSNPRKINLAADNNKTAKKILDHLTELNDSRYLLLECKYCASARGIRLYKVAIEMLSHQTEAFYVNLILDEVNKAVPLSLEVFNSFYDLKKHLTVYLKVGKKKKTTSDSYDNTGDKKAVNVKDFRTVTFDNQKRTEAIQKSSKSTNTEPATAEEKIEENIMQPTPNTQRYNCVPMDYKRENNILLLAHLSKPEVYDRARMVLAYLRYHKDTHLDGHTYVSLCSKLRSQGFPKNDDELHKVYVEFGASQGFAPEDIEEDLRVYRRYVENKHVSYINSVARNHDRYTGGRSTIGTCDPDPNCCILM